MSSPSKWELDGIFLMNHEKVMPWSSYSWLSSCPKIETFDTLTIFEPFLWNHGQDLTKWWSWLQNKMLTKFFNFWLPNDHFTPTVDCEAIRAFDSKCIFVDFWNWPIMSKLITSCESISWTWSVKMDYRKCHPLQNEHWMGFFWWTMKKLCLGQDTVDFSTVQK